MKIRYNHNNKRRIVPKGQIAKQNLKQLGSQVIYGGNLVDERNPDQFGHTPCPKQKGSGLFILFAWLWWVLRGQAGRDYNASAEESVSIAKLAWLYLAAFGAHVSFRVMRQVEAGHAPQHYVPDTRRVRDELNLPTPWPLDETLLRTAKWPGHPANSLT